MAVVKPKFLERVSKADFSQSSRLIMFPLAQHGFAEDIRHQSSDPGFGIVQLIQYNFHEI